MNDNANPLIYSLQIRQKLLLDYGGGFETADDDAVPPLQPKVKGRLPGMKVCFP